jgi:hypothetical protein
VKVPVGWPDADIMSTCSWLLTHVFLQVLQSMGLHAAFSPGADFSKAVQSPLYLTDVKQAVSCLQARHQVGPHDSRCDTLLHCPSGLVTK